MLIPMHKNSAPAFLRNTFNRASDAMSPKMKYRGMVAARAVLAIAGSYVLAALWATVLALYLQKTGMSPVDAVLTGSLSSFAVFACGVMWVFAARTVRKAFTGLLVTVTPLAALLLLALRTGGAA